MFSRITRQTIGSPVNRCKAGGNDIQTYSFRHLPTHLVESPHQKEELRGGSFSEKQNRRMNDKRASWSSAAQAALPGAFLLIGETVVQRCIGFEGLRRNRWSGQFGDFDSCDAFADDADFFGGALR
jgi:hypothetical protein